MPGDPAMNIEDATKYLQDLKDLFAEHLPQAKWFLHFGMALGAWYNGHFIKADHDLDIGILAETLEPWDFISALRFQDIKLGGFFAEKGYHFGPLLRHWCNNTLGVGIRVMKYGIPCDVVWLYKRHRKRWWLNWGGQTHVVPNYLFDYLKPVKMEGISVPAPYPLDAFCDNMWKRIGPLDRRKTLSEIFPAWDKAGEDGEEIHYMHGWPIHEGVTGFEQIVVYAYVCADPLHEVHVLALENAKGMGDKLIVGVLTDEAIMEKKPAPAITFTERLRAVKGLSCVDAVIAQKEYSPLQNIMQIKPDILIESDAHEPESAVEQVQFQWSGRIVRLPEFPHLHSSQIKENIRKGNK